MSIAIFPVTPEIAQRWVDHTDPNEVAQASPAHVRHYAQVMARGDWMRPAKSSPILIAANDKSVIDGLRRLLAVIKADVPVKMYVAEVPGITRPGLRAFRFAGELRRMAKS